MGDLALAAMAALQPVVRYDGLAVAAWYERAQERRSQSEAHAVYADEARHVLKHLRTLDRGDCSYRSSWVAQPAGRISQQPMVLQAAPRAAKAAAWASMGYVNLDIKASQMAVFQALCGALGLGERDLLGLWQRERPGLVEQLGELAKTMLYASLFGAGNERLIAEAAVHGKGHEAIRLFKDRMAPLFVARDETYRLMGRRFETHAGSGDGITVTNAVGKRIAVAEGAHKALCHLCQGAEAFAIHRATLAAAARGIRPISNEHDGLVLPDASALATVVAEVASASHEILGTSLELIVKEFDFSMDPLGSRTVRERLLAEHNQRTKETRQMGVLERLNRKQVVDASEARVELSAAMAEQARQTVEARRPPSPGRYTMRLNGSATAKSDAAGYYEAMEFEVIEGSERGRGLLINLWSLGKDPESFYEQLGRLGIKVTDGSATLSELASKVYGQTYVVSVFEKGGYTNGKVLNPVASSRAATPPMAAAPALEPTTTAATQTAALKQGPKATPAPTPLAPDTPEEAAFLAQLKGLTEMRGAR